MSASCDWASQKRTVSSLVGGRVVKRPKQEDGRRLQQAAIQLLEQHQDLRALLGELGNSARCNTSSSQNGEQQQAAPEGIAFAFTGSLLVWELQRQATQMGVAVVVLSVKTVVERLMEITGSEEEDEEKRRELLTSSQRAHLRILMKSSKELLSQGALCPKLLWQEYRREQRQPKLEVLYHLHYYSILSLNFVLMSDEGVRSWLLSQLKALCSWKPPEDEEETRTVQQKVFSMVAEVLVGTGFEQSHEPAASDRNISLLCCSVLDEMLFWLLDTVDQCPTQTPAGAEQWIKIFDASLCGVSVSADALRRFFTHSLTQTLTHKPRLTVSDAITQQNEWTFVKASRLLTSLLRKLAVLFNVELLLRHLQQVLETSEVNWRHVLCFLSTLLVYNPCAQPSVRELLSRLLTSAFEGYDLENMIVAFLLARQGALEGAGIFPSYSDWFKMCFGGVSSCHATSKKSLVFLLKFLSDLVPFEPPQYLKVHILHPPYVPVKHRSLLMEYVSLAKTRLADLKESVEDMGLYEDASGADGASVPAVQDVDKAVSLFESTGRISATVMEASIFRRPYFLTRFLPALLRPRVLPVKADARMNFIDTLKKSDKIPAAQYSSYLESCQRQQDGSTVCLQAADHPLDVLSAQLQTFTALTVDGSDGEMSAQLCRIAHTLSLVFSSRPEEPTGQTVIRLHEEALLSPELHVKVVDMILRCFCQCVLDASRTNPPDKQSMWASRFVSVLLGNMQLLSSLTHRLRDLFLNQGSSLSAAHLLGLAVFVVHFHCSMSHSPLVVIMPPILPKAAAVGEVLSSVLVCTTRTNMLLCVRLCVAAVCYGICKGDSLPQQQQQEHIPSSLYKKLLYLIPRLLPEARAPFSPDGSVDESQQNVNDLWSSVTDPSSAWRRTAWFLWRHTAFQQLQHIPEYQLLFCEWLDNELRVQRSEDALPDSERQEYQQWACLELYLPRPEQQGGCGGDMKVLCSHLLKAVMDQQLHQQSSNTGTCLPDILSRIQELLYETEVTELSGRRSRADVGDVLFDLVSQRCSSTVDSASLHASEELSLQHTVHTWNSLLLALPPGLFVKVKAEGGRTTLDCSKLIEHVNQHQRMACSPASSLSSPVTAHFLKGLLYASVRCRCPGEELNKAWCQMSLHCPLLLISTVHWWQRLSPVLLSLWRRLCDEEPLPEQLQLISSCHHWASSLEKGLFSSPAPPAPALLLAAGLHCAWRGYRGDSEGFSAALNMLRPERSVQYRQVLVFLLSLCINDCLSTLLYPKEKTFGKAWSFCTDLLTVLVDCADWLLIFKSEGQGVYQLVTMVTPDAFTRLMPWAFYSLLLQQSRDLLQRAERCPGFLHTAVLCYIRLLQLFLDGHVPTSTTEPCEQQVEPSQILSHSKEFVLTVISQTSPDALSSSQLRELESLCADLDPEVAAALSVHLSPHSLSPEMDFL